VKRSRFVHHPHKLFLWALTVGFPLLSVRGASFDDNWDTQFGLPGADGPIYSIVLAGSEVFVGGSFTQIGGTRATNVAKFDGSNWVALDGGLSGGIFPVVLALAFWNGELYAAGSFDRADDLPVSRIARWDGDSWKPLGAGVSGIVRALAVSQAKLAVGGTFTSAGGLPAANIAQWDGTNWSPLGSGVSWPFSGVAVDSLAAPGCDLYVGGRFRFAGGLPATNIARWNGTNWSALGKGLRHYDGPDTAGNGIVRAMVASHGKVFAGGEFSKAGDANVSNIAEWDGTNWTALGTGVGAVYALAATGSDIFAGGFMSADNHIARWSDGAWSQLGSGIGGGPEGGAVWALAATGSELFLGGPFGLAGGKPANYIALWHIPHALNIRQAQGDVILSWPATGTNFLLEATSNLGAPNWQGVSGTPGIVNAQCVVTLPLGPGNQFFRLRRR